ncbi:glycosyltransferase [Candidatus Pelagibacter sp.]|nr:glycosyltransferase [Candidatus Pelagibacter sp.]
MISVIIPTLNEKKNIQLISRKLLKIKFIHEIIFVDDNSSDGTFLEIKKLKKFKKIRGFLRKKNRDLCKAVIFGVNKAKKNNILVMDCDLQHDVFFIKKMWKNFNQRKVDMVIASRFKKKKFSGNLGFVRSLFSVFTIIIINIVLGKKTTDPLSGFFICKKEIITKYKKSFFAKGYKILFDIIYNGQNNLIIYDYGIIFKKRIHEKSKFNFKIIKLFFRQFMYTISLEK